MPGPFHTLTYPANRAGLRQGLAFPSKSEGDVRRYTLDLAAFVKDADAEIEGVTVQADPTLRVANLTWDASKLELTVAGGSETTPLPAIVFSVTLSGGGGIETVSVFQPIQPLIPRVPQDALGLREVSPGPPALADGAGGHVYDDFGFVLVEG